MTNTLFYGDNLLVLRDHVPDASVDLGPPFQREAASGGLFHSDLWQRDYPKIQLRTVEQMLSGQGFDLPPRPAAYQAAQRVRRPQGRQGEMEGLAG